MTDWKLVRGGTAENKPAEIDNFSSETTVYIRKDFNLIPIKFPMDDSGEETFVWEYLEKTYTKEEWVLISETTNAINIKHENDIRDEYMIELIEGGIL